MQTFETTTAPFDTALAGLDELLATYVDDAGMVDYPGLVRDRPLGAVLEALQSTDPGRLSRSDQMAFWINAYNAGTLKLVVDHYPVGSIKQITPVRLPGRSLYVPRLNSPWMYPVLHVGGRDLSLHHIEHRILRRAFRDPRLHFALVCAARSCPNLRREAYRGAALDDQLTDQGRQFLGDVRKNYADCDTLYLSAIFLWFRRDFTRSTGGLQPFLAPYTDGAIRNRLEQGNATLRYLPYDWSLNDQAEVRRNC